MNTCMYHPLSWHTYKLNGDIVCNICERIVNKPLIDCKYHPKAYIIEDYKTGNLICSVCGLIIC